MGSAVNFFTFVTQLHDEMQKSVVNRTRLLFEEILITEKRALLDQIKILIDRECNNPLSSFQWQLNENLLQFQCLSCSGTFSSNQHGTIPVKRQVDSPESDSDDQDFTADPFLDNLNDNANEPPVYLIDDDDDDDDDDVKPQIVLQEAASEPKELQNPIENQSVSLAGLQLNTHGLGINEEIEHEIFVPEPQEDNLENAEEVSECLTFKCPYRDCSYSCTILPTLKKHVRQNHTGKSLPCVKCSVGFHEQSKKFTKHLKRHTSTAPTTECKYCHRQFARPISLESHQRECNPLPDPNGTRKCDGCLQKFKNSVGLNRHKNWCVPTYVSCDQCNKKYKSSQHLNDHKKYYCTKLKH